MQRYFAKNIEDNKITLSNSDMHHIKNVMRMKENDKVEVVYDKKTYLCNLDNNLELHIDTVINEDKELPKEIIAIIGLVKEQKMDLVLQKLTELGVSKIIPVNMERSIVKLDTKKEDKKLIRWNTICKEASEQSKRNTIPIVINVINFKDIINIEADLKLCCSVSEKDNIISNYLSNNNYNSVSFVIGPEGGLTLKEENYLKENNYNLVSLGSLVFRMETACIYMASILNYETNKNR